MKLYTVNIIEWCDDTIQQIVSFSDDKAGNKAAEKLFRKCALENGGGKDNKELGWCVENGYYDCASYHLHLVHSS